MIEAIGGFDEDFFAYADDAELGLRARIAGWDCLNVPAAVVRHHVGQTLGRYSEQRLFLIERNRIWLAVKLFPLRLLLLNPFYYCARVIATAFAAGFGHGELSKMAHSTSLIKVARCVLRANVAAFAGLPSAWRKRREIGRIRKLSTNELMALLRRYRVPLVDLVAGTRDARYVARG
jgi:GT2 family glycosyltransferase